MFKMSEGYVAAVAQQPSDIFGFVAVINMKFATSSWLWALAYCAAIVLLFQTLCVFAGLHSVQAFKKIVGVFFFVCCTPITCALGCFFAKRWGAADSFFVSRVSAFFAVNLQTVHGVLRLPELGSGFRLLAARAVLCFGCHRTLVTHFM